MTIFFIIDTLWQLFQNMVNIRNSLYGFVRCRIVEMPPRENTQLQNTKATKQNPINIETRRLTNAINKCH